MKQGLVPRIIGIIALYCVVLVGLVTLQFTKKTTFTVTVGSLVVSGNYEDADSGKNAAKTGEYALAGPVSVFYKGMEFLLSESAGLSSVSADKKVQGLTARSLKIKDGGVTLGLSDGNTVDFITQFSGGSELLRIQSAVKGAVDLLLPFRPMRSAHVADETKGRFTVALGDVSYTFSGAPVDTVQRILRFRSDNSLISYGPVPDRKKFNPADYILSAALDPQAYQQALGTWRTKALSWWERAMAGTPDEDTIIAYVAESARRGNYRSAVATAPSGFAANPQRSYRSSVYFGHLDMGLRSLAASEREYLGRLSRLDNERSMDLLAEPNVFAYLAIRGSRALMDDAAAFVKTIDPTALSPLSAVGVLEGWKDWKTYRPGEGNPFDTLIDQASFVIATTLRRVSDTSVYVLVNDQVDPAFNLRTANALIGYGTAANLGDWTGIGRSIVLTMLGMYDPQGSMAASYKVSSDGNSLIPSGDGTFSSARFYRFIAPREFFPRAESISVEGLSGVWAWTGAGSISATMQDGVLDIAVDFPVGETHFMMLRGIKPFTKMQLYGIDFRTDSEFERYDSSGWAYSSSEQTLLLKMKHKSPTEHIRIFF